jgi:nucleolar protein TMA23
MWWINAFDKSLKGLDTSEEGRVVQTVTNGGLDMVARGGSKFVGSGGLYAFFVRGESLSGTITLEATEVSNPASPPTKVREQSASTGETKEERRARKAAKLATRAGSSLVLESLQPVSTDKVEDETADNAEAEAETKEQRRERRKQKKLLRLERAISLEGRSPSKVVKRKKRRAE